MLRVVEIDELQLLQAQQAQAALNAAPHLGTVEDACPQIAVGFRCQHKAGWKPTKLAKHASNATLALTISIGSSSVQKVEGTRKESTDRAQGTLFGNFIGEVLWHTPQWG